MPETIKTALRVAAIIGLCLAAGLIAGAGIARAVAGEPEAGGGDLPSAAVAPAPLAGLDDPAGLVFDWLDGIRSMKAAFIQQGPTGAMARGTMYLARPGKARFEYEPSVPILIVADGDVLRFIDYEIGQVTPLPVKETPLALLLEPTAQLRQRIEIVDAGPGPLAGSLAIAVRDPKHPEYGTLTLFFERGADAGPSGLTLRGWQVL
ncbi:MAG: hypothetical protein D6782_02130, partial [Alphaproteobacteria bacterium]